MKKRFIIMLSGIIVISLGWILGWNYLSDKAEQAFEVALAHANNGNQKIACPNHRTNGFPFHLNFQCDTPSYANAGGLEITTAGLNAHAFVYRPLHQVVDFSSPGTIKTKDFGSFQLTWERARIGSKLQTGGLDAATVKLLGAMLTLKDPPQELRDTAISIQSIVASARRTSGEEPQNSVVFGIISKGLSVLGSKYALPPVNMEGSVLAYDIAPAFEGRHHPLPLWIQQGGEADINGLHVMSGNAQLFIKGWVKLDQNGFVNADLDIDAIDLLEFVDKMGTELIQIQNASRAVIGTLEALGKDVTLDGKPAKRVTMNIRNGFIKIGIIPLGTIPQIDVTRF